MKDYRRKYPLIHPGPEYHASPIFDLSAMEPYNLRVLHDAFAKVTSDFVLYLPRSSDYNQLSDIVPKDKELLVTHYCMRGASKVCQLSSDQVQELMHLKALCAYFGNFSFS